MKTHPTDDVVRRLARVRDEAMHGTAGRPAARALLDDITALPAKPVRTSRRLAGHVSLARRRLVLGAAAAAVLAAAGVIGVTTMTGDTAGRDTIDRTDVKLAAAVQIIRKDTYYEARIVDPRADQKRFRAAFARYGLDIDVNLVPASPSVVGTIVFMDGDEKAQRSEREGHGIKVIEDPSCRTASGANCPIGIRISLKFHGHAGVVIGREAAPGEPYSSTNPKDAPQDLRGMTVTRAEAALARKGLRIALYNVQWSTPSGVGYGDIVPRARVNGRWTITSVEPYSPGAVMLMIQPTGPVPPDVIQKMRREAKAAPTPTPYATSR